MFINKNGTWIAPLHIKANVNGTWQLIRNVYVNVNGTWKQVSYTPQDKIYTDGQYASSLVYWYYGSDSVFLAPWIHTTTYNNVTQMSISVGISSGAGLNISWEVYTSPVESYNSSDYVATGIKFTPTSYDPIAVSGTFSARSIKMVVIRPDSWFSGSFSYYCSPSYYIYNL